MLTSYQHITSGDEFISNVKCYFHHLKKIWKRGYTVIDYTSTVHLQITLMEKIFSTSLKIDVGKLYIIIRLLGKLLFWMWVHLIKQIQSKEIPLYLYRKSSLPNGPKYVSHMCILRMQSRAFGGTGWPSTHCCTATGICVGPKRWSLIRHVSAVMLTKHGSRLSRKRDSYDWGVESK